VDQAVVLVPIDPVDRWIVGRLSRFHHGLLNEKGLLVNYLALISIRGQMEITIKIEPSTVEALAQILADSRASEPLEVDTYVDKVMKTFKSLSAEKTVKASPAEDLRARLVSEVDVDDSSKPPVDIEPIVAEAVNNIKKLTSADAMAMLTSFFQPKGE
jgi:hypothetical protein